MSFKRKYASEEYVQEKIDELRPVSWNNLTDKPFGEESIIFTVEHTGDSQQTELEGFPAFVAGDVVKVTVDGEEYALVAYDVMPGSPVIGDDPMQGPYGELGWAIGCDTFGAAFLSIGSHTVSYSGIKVNKIEKKYVPLEGFIKKTSYYIGGDYTLIGGRWDSDGSEVFIYLAPNLIIPHVNENRDG